MPRGCRKSFIQKFLKKRRNSGNLIGKLGEQTSEPNERSKTGVVAAT